MIRPTARLRFEIDEGQLTDELKGRIKNNYLNVAPVFIGPRPAIKDARIAENVLGLVAVLNSPYWDPSDEAAEDNWREVMLPWLKAKLFKLGATVRNYNETAAKLGFEKLQFGQLEVILGDKVAAFALDEGSGFPEEAIDLLCEFRELSCKGALGDSSGFMRVEIPYVDPEEKAREEPADEAGAPAGEDTGQGPDGPYRLWGVRGADGSVRAFDTTAMAWADGE